MTYTHSDMIGTTRHMTNSSGNGVGAVVYTAFGERVTGGSHYYGYAGAWGYEKEDLPFLHVGHRYYDPAIGRFLQRDPIGIEGGLNAYAYVFNRPTISVDPTGKSFVSGLWSAVKIGAGAVAGVVGGALVYAGAIGTAPVWVAGIGLAVLVAGVWVAISEIADLLNTANKVVKPIRKPVKRRNRAVDNAIDCAELGMGED